MRKVTAALCALSVAVLLLAAWSSAAAAPGVTIRVDPLPKKSLELAVGESITFEIQVSSREPFLLAIAMTDQYYPGRGIYWQGTDRQTWDTSATLHLTMTGKATTSDLYAVCDWPEPGVCWPEGVAPVAIAAGVRFQGGETVGQRFPFAVVVP